MTSYPMIGNPPVVAVPTHYFKVVLGVKPSGKGKVIIITSSIIISSPQCPSSSSRYDDERPRQFETKIRDSPSDNSLERISPSVLSSCPTPPSQQVSFASLPSADLERHSTSEIRHASRGRRALFGSTIFPESSSRRSTLV